MAFTPVDLPIQEILQTDFVVDIAQIHNSNVLLLKDKLEDFLNNFEVDSNSISIGTDNPINSLRTTDIVIQDSGFIFQTGIPNQIISRLSKNGSDESVLNVDHLTVDLDIQADSIAVNDLVISNSTSISGPTTISNTLRYDESIVESKETISVTMQRQSTGIYNEYATGTITLTSTSNKNIYVTLGAETTVGATQVWTGTGFNGTILGFALIIDFDASNPPAANTSFTIHIVDVVENSGSSSIVSNINLEATPPPVSIDPGVNQNTAGTIIMHHDLVAENQKLAVNHNLDAMFKTQALLPYGHNATFNYIVDSNTNDRLVITNMVGLEIY
jgi:hypothetical protein